MNIARKEKWLGIAGLIVALAGGVWFGLSVATEVFEDSTKMFGIFLGAGVLLSGLIIAAVYFFRMWKIKNLTSGKRLLAQWQDGSQTVFIGLDSAYVDGNLHLWSGGLGRLEKVALVEKGLRGPTGAYLEIDYANTKQRRDLVTGRWTKDWESHTISISVPPDMLTTARLAVDQLQQKVAR